MWNLTRLKGTKKRAVEILSVPTMVLFGFILRVFLSFTSIVRAILLSWGVIDGVASNYIYKEEKFFPYQFLRYGRIVANVCGIVNPFIAVAWNIGDGFYSLHLYRQAAPAEDLARYGRILNGSLLAVI